MLSILMIKCLVEIVEFFVLKKFSSNIIIKVLEEEYIFFVFFGSFFLFLL